MRELTDLMDALVALRVDLCKDGNPAHPADHLGAEQIKTLCYLATVAIDLTHRIAARENADATGGHLLGWMVRRARTSLQQNLPGLPDPECSAERGLELRGVANLLHLFSQRVGL